MIPKRKSSHGTPARDEGRRLLPGVERRWDDTTQRAGVHVVAGSAQTTHRTSSARGTPKQADCALVRPNRLRKGE